MYMHSVKKHCVYRKYKGENRLPHNISRLLCFLIKMLSLVNETFDFCLRYIIYRIYRPFAYCVPSKNPKYCLPNTIPYINYRILRTAYRLKIECCLPKKGFTLTYMLLILVVNLRSHVLHN